MTQGYDEMIKLNKPFALGEVDPHTPDGNFDLGQLQFKIVLN
jgi:hypothetical protein